MLAASAAFMPLLPLRRDGRGSRSRYLLSSTMHRALILTALFGSLGLGIFVSGAGAGVASLEADRDRFLAAERAFLNGDDEQYVRLRDSLRGYPLYPYLIVAELERELPRLDASRIDDFLRTWVNTPLAARLRNRWLTSLAERERWQELLDAYDSGIESTELRCLRRRALLETGRIGEALEGVEQLWLVPRSQPKACDPVFARWRDAGHLTPKRVWGRFRLAIDAGQIGLARYVERFLPAADRVLATRWRQIREEPRRVEESSMMTSRHPVAHEITVWGMVRLARLAPEDAVRAWSVLGRGEHFSPSERAAIEERIGLSFAYRSSSEATRWLAEIPEAYISNRGREWRILIAMRYGQWKAALDWLTGLEPEIRARERWQYWEARCLSALGRDREAAEILRGVARGRSYYGFLAADRLRTDYQLNHRALDFLPRELDEIESRPALRRARELFELERWDDARREWHQATHDMNPAQLEKAAKIAQRWGWYSRAIFTVAQAASWDDLEIRFPLLFETDVSRESRAYSLDRAWVFAIIRQESAFMPDARSAKGALGLMQILPATGRLIARSIKDGKFRTSSLLDPQINVRFGSHYLRDLLNRMQGNHILATAAYNAGPNRVHRWLPTEEALPPDLWIETVPFGETRSYLQRVFAYSIIYQMRLGEAPIRLSDRLAPIAIATPAEG